ncbi:hypothetical protein [Actinomadura madurae]|uniref:hypothetical protein n=1 Tax=Actinomadura madurae TaxID=1993 RepID=UPI0020D25C2B|nr:hypothetical protein [Actinomadura madurae]MCQ0013820.1 hypothetical protein [Actinomadura madurae]
MSQIEGPRPSSRAAPSIWYAAVAAPQTKPGGKVRGRWSVWSVVAVIVLAVLSAGEGWIVMP